MKVERIRNGLYAIVEYSKDKNGKPLHFLERIGQIKDGKPELIPKFQGDPQVIHEVNTVLGLQ